jgi:hypothetical protein
LLKAGTGQTVFCGTPPQVTKNPSSERGFSLRSDGPNNGSLVSGMGWNLNSTTSPNTVDRGYRLGRLDSDNIWCLESFQKMQNFPEVYGSGNVPIYQPFEYLTSWADQVEKTFFAAISLVIGIAALEPLRAESPARPAAIASRPLAERADDLGSTLFETLPAHRTRIDFTFVWDPPERYKWFFDNTVGGGVAIGDYDNDGLPDIFLTRGFGGSRLYRNNGDFVFDDATVRAGLDDKGTWAMSSSFADVDNDGDLDLFVCDYDSSNRLYQNLGDGTMIERASEAGLDFTGASIMMAFADYDRDGDLDGYLLTNRYLPATGRINEVEIIKKNGRRIIPDELSELVDIIIKPDGREKIIKIGQEDKLYRNNGDGTFSDVTASAGISGRDMGLGIIWWDFNGDGWPDIYVSNDFYGSDKLYRNNRNGTFSDVIEDTVPHTPWFSMGVDAADINNDGLMDLMASDMAATTHYKAKVNMGEMEEQGWFLESAEPRQYMRNAVYLNSGAGRFMEIASLLGLANTDWTWSVKFADFDNDGWIDLFVSNGMTRNWFNSDLRRRARRLGGLNTEEGGNVFLESSPLQETNLAYRNTRGLRFDDVSQDWGLADLGVSFGAATGDIDGDGDLDLVVNNFEAPVSIYRNRSIKGNRVTIRLIGRTSNRYGVGATVRVKSGNQAQMRTLTQASGFASANEPIIHFGFGENETIDVLSVTWPMGQVQRFNRLPTGRAYTISEPSNPGSVSIPDVEPIPMFKGLLLDESFRHEEDDYDDFADQPLLPNRLSRLGPGIALRDVNGDGIEEIYIGGAAGQPGRLLTADSSRPSWSEIPAAIFDAHRSREDMGALFFDSDSDGDADLFVVSGGPGRYPFDARLRDRLYLNDGSGNFEEARAGTLPDIRDSGGTVAAADFDRDGDLDLFVGGRYVPRKYPTTPSSRLLLNESGRFLDATPELAPDLTVTGLVTSALWSDADQDGWLDLLITNEWGSVRLYHNREGHLVDATEEVGFAQYLGWWNSITGRDIDNDGDIDYAVANVGLNTKYHADPNNPVLLYYGNFGLKGKMRLVEASYEGEEIYPIRGRSCSTIAIPHLGLEFESFHEFANASLDEIYTSDRLERAERLAVNTLESGLFLNDGNGRFHFRPLPRLAQAAPGFGLVLTEVDGDGHADLFMVQNFFGPQPETGQMDGGVSILLLGNGDGAFSPVWPNRSGLFAYGDANALSSVDLNDDDWVDFAITQNDGPLIAFENRGSQKHKPFTVRLKGEPGNLAAIGSHVTVILDNGSRQTAEIYAGSGYLSQSTNTLFFGLGESGSAVQVEVRWPDGSESTHTLPSGARRAKIKHP